MNKWINIILISWLLTAVVASIAIVCGVIIRESINEHPIGTPIYLLLVFVPIVVIINKAYNKLKGL